MQPLSGNQRADLLRSLKKMSFVLRLPPEMHLCRSSSNVPGLKLLQTLTFCWFFTRCKIPCTCHAKTHLNSQKWSEHSLFHILTWKCASRHNNVHFFDISTSKSAPRLRFFSHLNFETCFPPQRRTLFEYLNFQKRSERRVFCAFWLVNVLRAKTACNFSTSQLPKVLLTCQFFITFDFEVSFAPQRHTLSRHLNFQECSVPGMFCTLCFTPQRRRLFERLNCQKCTERGVLCTFWLGNVLRATTAFTFLTSELRKVLGTRCVLYIVLHATTA